MPEFRYTDLLPLGPDDTEYRLVTPGGVTARSALGRDFLEVEPGVLTELTMAAMRDIQHLLRPGHLRQLRSILEDPEASGNDRFVARDLLKNACIAAGGVLPMCQDTGTAIVMGKRGQQVLTDGRDEEHIARGVYDAYTQLNLRYSQLAPLTMWEEKNTGSNLPAQIEVYATGGGEYKFLFMAKGGGSANKSFLFQQTKAVLNPAGMRAFLTEKIRSLGTAACPPYHLAVVIGGTSAEFALKTAKYASAKYLDTLPASGSMAGHGFRDLELEEQVLGITRRIGIGAQFGGKYFCHDVRVIRLPRHGASCPVAIAVSCSADRQALGKITAEGAFLEEKIRSLGTAACPPYHLAIVIGGTSAEFALKTAKYASAKYLDGLPTEGSAAGHGFRDRELEEQVLGITRRIGIGAQFGGKYFCHDVRVVRLPRHGASCPVAIAVSCSADRQALGKITRDGVFLEQLETDPAQYLPDPSELEDEGEVVAIDLSRPMDEIRAELTRYPVRTRLSLTGPLVGRPSR